MAPVKAFLLAAPLFVTVSATAAELLLIDQSHSAVLVSWTHRGLSHPVARFEKIKGSIMLDVEALTRSSATIEIPVDGLKTGDDALDIRLRTAEFFDLKSFPIISFQSEKIEIKDATHLTLFGTLTLHGVSRSTALNVTINKIVSGAGGNDSAGFDAETSLRRSDFALGKYVPMTGDDIAVRITVEAHQHLD
jgi:polyisoprenoid-binding protein YceI